MKLVYRKACSPLVFCEWQVKVIKMLLKLGADPLLKDKRGLTTFHLCSHRGDPKGLAFCLTLSATVVLHCFHAPLLCRFQLLVNFLTELKAETANCWRMRDAEDMTPLHYAAMFNSTKHVKALVGVTSTISSDGRGRLPLHWALDTPTPSAPLVTMLLDVTAETSLNYRDGSVPFLCLAHRPLKRNEFCSLHLY